MQPISTCSGHRVKSSRITGHIKCGDLRKALSVYQIMQDNVAPLCERTFVALLKACVLLNDIETGYQIHTDVARNGLLETNLFVGNSVIDMYVKCGFLAKGEEVFHSLPVRDVVTWTALIGGCAELGYDEGALNCFKQMQ
eukprot:c26253_g1_i1 orf=484-903(+)